MPDLEAYVKLPATVPTGRVKMRYKAIEAVTKGFVARTATVAYMENFDEELQAGQLDNSEELSVNSDLRGEILKGLAK